MESLEELRRALNETMRVDYYRLHQWWHRVWREFRRGGGSAEDLARLKAAIEESCRWRAARAASVPPVRYDAALPITAFRKQIAEATRQWPVVIVCGETGSGKSTQVPKICLELGRGVSGRIGHTQPRRLAAESIASRLAYELGCPLGSLVGYKVRFAQRVSRETLIKFVTDGMLLAETQSDRFLDQYDTLILDEVHERSLNIDFLLGYLRRLLPRRPDLRVILMSATLEAARFQDFFATRAGPAPIIEIPGRRYPVDIRYRPVELAEGEVEPDYARSVRAALEELSGEPAGDVLVFLPTERDIRETARLLRGWCVQASARRWEILPLYARLPPGEQQRVFEPHQQPRIILATNVAESSLTVPGIRYVIDTGTARISRYSPRAKIQRLPIEPISRASADQRAGRCGRTEPGVCIRLYSEDDYLGREAYTTPEIRRTNLASVILQAKCLGLGDLSDLLLLDPPKPEAIADGMRTLRELDALDTHGALTPLGKQLGQFPIDPRLGRMILAAIERQCVEEVLIVAAALEVGDPRLRPADRQEAADQAHRMWHDERSDFMVILNLWDFFVNLRQNLSRSQLRAACSQHYLSYTRMREWAELYRQLRHLVTQVGHRLSSARHDYAAIHQSLLTGLLSGIGYRHQAYEYRGARNSRFYLWPGSAVFASRPRWIVAAEVVETNRRYARTVAAIEPEWLETLAPHLLEIRHGTPFWSRRRAAALVHERVRLFGLPIVQNRIVPLGPIDPSTARQMFIDHGLVDGQMVATFRFLEHNRRMLQKVLQWAHKSRDTVWWQARAALANFYEERLPPQVYDLARLRAWLPAAERSDPQRLYVPWEVLVPANVSPPQDTQYPDVFPVERCAFPLSYHFEPGSTQDGITVTVPAALVPELDADQWEWFIPGRLEEKITELIRSLPSHLRRCLIPAPDTARAIASELTFGQGPFLKTLARALSRRGGVPVTPDDFRLDQIPKHLRFHFRVVAPDGATLLVTQDWNQVCRAVAAAGATPVQSPWHADGLTEWSFGDISQQMELSWGPVSVVRFPTLVDQGDSVSQRLAATEQEAESHLQQAVRRLFVLAEKPLLRAAVAWLPQVDQLQRYAACLMDIDAWERDVMDLIASRAWDNIKTIPRTADEFHRLCDGARERIPLAVQEVTALLEPLFANYHTLRQQLRPSPHPLLQEAYQDIETHLSRLVQPRFLVRTPWYWLQQFPRYFQACAYRWQRLYSGNLARDRQAMLQWQQRWQEYVALEEEHRELGIHDPQRELYRWMLEEYRVALFAQHLGTALPVSPKRLDAQWALVRRVGTGCPTTLQAVGTATANPLLE